MKILWKRLDIRARLALVAGLLIGAAAVVTVARRDLGNRDPVSVRGNPGIWDGVTHLPGGAVAYLALGRRSRREDRPAT